VLSCKGYQVADAVIRNNDQPRWLLEIKITEVGLNEGQVVKDPSPISPLAAAREHSGRSVNTDHRTPATRGFHRDPPVSDTQLDNRTFSGKILLEVEREILCRGGGRVGPNRVDVSEGVIFGFGNLTGTESIGRRRHSGRIPVQQDTCDSLT